MKYRGALIGLSLFMVVALALTWLVYVGCAAMSGEDGPIRRGVHRCVRPA